MRSLDVFLCRYVSIRDVSREYENDLRVTVRKFSESLVRAATLDDLTADNFAVFAFYLATPSASASTTNNRLRQLKTLWFAAAEDGLMPPPPRKLKRLKERAHVIEGWDAEQFGRLLREVAKMPTHWRLRIASALWLAWNTGLRRGDLFALQKSQVAQDGSIAHVQRKTGRVIRRQLWPETLAAIAALEFSGPTLLPRRNLRWLGIYVRRCCKAGGVPEGAFKFARRGSSSEVEKKSPGQGWRWCGHAAPGLFEKSYRVERICGENTPEPAKPIVAS